jgi:hypothetical protein
MTSKEKKLFLRYRDLHQQFYDAIRLRRSENFIRAIYNELQKAWKEYVDIRKFSDAVADYDHR